MHDHQPFVVSLGIGLTVIALYFVPSIVGHKKRAAAGIFILNLLLGWTVLGWIGALVWAVTPDPDPRT